MIGGYSLFLLVSVLLSWKNYSRISTSIRLKVSVLINLLGIPAFHFASDLRKILSEQRQEKFKNFHPTPLKPLIYVSFILKNLSPSKLMPIHQRTINLMWSWYSFLLLQVNGTLKNTGHSVRFRLDPDSTSVSISGGPLSYKYRVHEILLHYGRSDDKGSEHTISGHAFPAEVSSLIHYI